MSSLLCAETDGIVMLRTRELCKHYMEHPEARVVGLEVFIRKLFVNKNRSALE